MDYGYLQVYMVFENENDNGFLTQRLPMPHSWFTGFLVHFPDISTHM